MTYREKFALKGPEISSKVRMVDPEDIHQYNCPDGVGVCEDMPGGSVLACCDADMSCRECWDREMPEEEEECRES